MASEVVAHLVAWLVNPFLGLVEPGEKIFVLHLIGSVLVALLALRLAGHPAPFREMFAPRVWGHPSARVDRRYYIVNGVLGAALLFPLFAVQRSGMEWVAARLTESLGARQSPHAPALWVVGSIAIAAALVSDLSIYLPHWLQHRIPVLWQFHKVHHSAEVLTPFTVYRFHPVDDVLNIASATGMVAVFDGVLLWRFPTQAVHLTLFDVNLVLFAFYVFGVHLRHSHVWLAYPAMVSRVFISPAMHQVHHSTLPEHHGKNLGLIFSVWDRLFGTLYIPERRLELTYGLGDGEEREFSTVRRLYWLPFVKAARLFRRG